MRYRRWRIGRSLLLMVFLPVWLGSLAQQIGVPWFPGWQGPFPGTTDARGYFEIVVLRTSDAAHTITGTLYDATTHRPIANSPVSLSYYQGLYRGTQVEISVPGYRVQRAMIKSLLSSYDPTRRPPTHRTYDVGAVYLFPSTGQPGTLILYPVKDATIRGYSRWRSHNYGSGPDLIVTPEYSGMVHPGEDRVMIRFDFSQIPTGAQVRKATLKLCVWEFHGDSLVVAVYSINRPWDEDTVTWETHHDAYDYQVMVTQAKLSGLSSGDWAEFDVTNSVRNALASGIPHYGWMLIPIGSSYTKFTEAKFYSKERGRPAPGAFPGTLPAKDRRPMLVIEFGPSTVVPIKDKTMCKDVQRTPPYDPVDRTSIFTIRDGKAVAWVKLGPLYTGHRVEFHWYYLDDPAGPSRVHLFRYDIPDPKQQGQTKWDWYVVWSEFRYGGTLYARLPRPSHWEVKIYVDGAYVDALYFTIVD